MNRFPLSHAARVKAYWQLDSAITFLNHGSFGACPRVVMEAQTRVRAQMEAEPVRFFLRECEPLLDRARVALGAFLGANAEDLVFVPNATAGVNSVLRSLSFLPTDEILTTNHAYNACRNALDFVAERTWCKIVVVDIPFPLRDSAEVLEAIVQKTTKRTRLCLLDHVASPTGLVFPMEMLVRELSARGVETLVDGAHAPGMLPLDLNGLGAAYYTGNCHKWMLAPKGAAFLHVRKDKQEGIHPLAISHGRNSPRVDRSRYQLEFDWTGTDDPSPILVLPEAIAFLQSLLPGGAQALMEHNRQMALAAGHFLAQSLSIPTPAPESMVGALYSVPLPEGGVERTSLGLDPLQDALFFDHRIEVPIVPFPALPARLVRISAQIYNDEGDYRRLSEALLGKLSAIA